MTVTSMDQAITELVGRCSQIMLAIWAADCAERVLSYFETPFADDPRPRQAIDAARAWARGDMRIGALRQAALSAHAAARAAEGIPAAVAAARAAGHAAATGHVVRHAGAAGVYAATAVAHGAGFAARDHSAAHSEREWQYWHLISLTEEATTPDI